MSAKRKSESPYIKCSYILGSVAEVERLWSLAQYVTPHNQQKMQPVNVKAHMFLKANASYWNVGLVHEALVELKYDVK
jgi:glucose-6-phosphate-specific signal transduction histidine kinase